MKRGLIVAVIDGAKPSMLERAAAEGRAPTLALLMERGSYVDDAVAVFPSVTPVCAASIATGVAQDRHLIPSMNWYHRDKARYVEYGSSFRAARRFGIARQLTDTVYNMNRSHLAAEVPTVFERLDDAGLRTACTTYLIYRGRHSHEAAQDTALTRLAAIALGGDSVLGPRELFYADIFASRDTGCRSQLGLPGVRDQHAGCVGEYLVTRDLFDFLLLSLPDNDNHSHRNGPYAQVESIAAADLQLTRLVDAAGGADRFLERYGVIVVADHSHAAVERSVSLADELAEFTVLQPADPSPELAEIALCPAQRSGMVYLLDPSVRERVVECVRSIEGVDLAMWRDGPEAVIAREGAELRFAPGEQISDLRGRRWALRGEPEVIAAQVDGDVVRSEPYPDALGRIWDALACPTSGDLLLSAAPGFEFADWGGVHHVGGGSHGSLHASDSLAPLLCCGVEGEVERQQWSIKDVAALVLAHFEL